MAWQRVKGHEHLVQAFNRIVRHGRLAHAYLFTGPAGVGKRLFAGELAKALLCEGPAGDSSERDRLPLEACDQCPACLQVEAGTHPDFFTAARPEEKLEFPIEVMRELCRSLGLKAARGKGKVALLDDADDLNDEAANCFLKTLEEPPPGTVLILIGTSEDRQLATIVSRCQVMRFAPLSEALVAELLRAQGMEDAAFVKRLASLSGGSLGLARLLADPALWDFQQKLVQGLIAPQPRSVALTKEWHQFVEDAGKESASQRRRAALVLRLLVKFLQNALSLSLGRTPHGAADELANARQLAGRAEPEQLLRMLERCLEADAQIDRRVQLVLVLEALVDDLVQLLNRPAE